MHYYRLFLKSLEQLLHSIKWEKEKEIFFSYPTNRHFLGAGPAIGQEALQGGVIQGSIGVLL